MKKFFSLFFSWLVGTTLCASIVVLPTYAQQTTIPPSWEEVTQNTAVHGGVNVAGGTSDDKKDRIIQVVKNFINYVLGFLGLIALVFLLIGGFKIVTAGGNENAHQEGVKVLKNAAIGIAFIGIAWFLVTFIFYVFSLVTK